MLWKVATAWPLAGSPEGMHAPIGPTVIVFVAGAEVLNEFVAVSVAVYVLLAVYVCSCVWVLSVQVTFVPSPNWRFRLVIGAPPGVVAEASNVTLNGTDPEVGLAASAAVGV